MPGDSAASTYRRRISSVLNPAFGPSSHSISRAAAGRVDDFTSLGRATGHVDAPRLRRRCHQHRHRGHDALAHLDLGHHDRDAVVRSDAQPDVGRKDAALGSRRLREAGQIEADLQAAARHAHRGKFFRQCDRPGRGRPGGASGRDRRHGAPAARKACRISRSLWRR